MPESCSRTGFWEATVSLWRHLIEATAAPLSPGLNLPKALMVPPRSKGRSNSTVAPSRCTHSISNSLPDHGGLQRDAREARSSLADFPTEPGSRCGGSYGHRFPRWSAKCRAIGYSVWWRPAGESPPCITPKGSGTAPPNRHLTWLLPIELLQGASGFPYPALQLRVGFVPEPEEVGISLRRGVPDSGGFVRMAEREECERFV